MIARINALYSAIIATVEMDELDKAELFDDLHEVSEEMLSQLESIYVG